LVFAVGTLPERRVWRNGTRVRTDFILTIGNKMLRDHD
jgi:hypothetical protein